MKVSMQIPSQDHEHVHMIVGSIFCSQRMAKTLQSLNKNEKNPVSGQKDVILMMPTEHQLCKDYSIEMQEICT